MKKSTSTLFLIFAIIYFISPLDAAPGIIDDVVLLMLALMSKKDSDD